MLPRTTSWLVVLIAVVLFLLGACSDNAASGTAQQQTPSDQQQESAAPLVIPPLAPDGGSGPLGDQQLRESDHGAAESIHAGPSYAILAARDPRIAMRRPRSRALVLTELQGLERLFDTTKVSSPDRPQIRRRIAEDYNELAATSSGADASHARDESIKQYRGIVNETPNFSTLDEVLYFLGLAYELNGDAKNGRATYYDLIKRFPQSKYIPHAYFAFGELFFNEALSDPSKNDLAVQAYTEVIKYPAPANGLFADALLRLGETHLRKKETAKSKSYFDRLKRDFPASDAASQIPTP